MWETPPFSLNFTIHIQTKLVMKCQKRSYLRFPPWIFEWTGKWRLFPKECLKDIWRISCWSLTAVLQRHYRPDRLFPNRTISKGRWAFIAFVGTNGRASLGWSSSFCHLLPRTERLDELEQSSTLFIENFVTAAWLGIINT